MATSVEKVFMSRDGETSLEARNHKVSLSNEVNDILANGGGYDEVEDLLYGEGLEMDYIFDLI